jgi:hypothetical protein
MREEFGVTEMPLAICLRRPDILPDYLTSIVPDDWVERAMDMML